MPSDVVADSTDIGTDRPNLKPIKGVGDHFIPFQVPPNVSWVNLPPNITPLDAAGLWSLFFTSEMLQIIAKNTNLHAKESRRRKKQGPKSRTFSETNESKLKAYFGIRIYMGLHREPRVPNYWNLQSNKPLHPLVRAAMALNRYQDIDRFLYFSEYKENNTVFQKVEPISSLLAAAFKKYWKPGRYVAVDEVMQRYKGRSHDTLTISTKPTPEGYKIWVVADEGYVLSWIYHRRIKGPLNVKVPKELGSNKTATVVADLLDQLPKQKGYTYGVFLDNLFTSHKLLLYLRKRGYGATGTARTNSGMYKEFIALKKKDKKQDKIPWGELRKTVTPDNQVMQFAWKDNSIVLFQSTMFDGQNYTIRNRKRPSKTSISARTARAPFGDQSRANLSIPTFDDVYNHYMRLVDQADQLRASYAYNRRCRSGGHKALYEFLIEISVINAYKLSLHSKVPKEAKYTVHSEFRTALATGLIQASKRLLLKRKRTSSESTIEGLTEHLEDHQICRRESLEVCRGCIENGTTATPRKRQILGEITPNMGDRKRRRRTTFGCNICNVPLCKDGSCWATYHKSVSRINSGSNPAV